MFSVREKYRLNVHPVKQLCSDSSFGNNGVFKIPLSNSVTAWIIASDGSGWEHVSVHVEDDKLPRMIKNKVVSKGQRMPTWNEMCRIKDFFWDDEDCVVQYHPPKCEYVNNHQFTLHLWRQIGKEFPMPNSILVGIK